MGDVSHCPLAGGGCRVHEGLLGILGRGTEGTTPACCDRDLASLVSVLHVEELNVSYMVLSVSSSGIGSEVIDSRRGASGRLLSALILR